MKWFKKKRKEERLGKDEEQRPTQERPLQERSGQERSEPGMDIEALEPRIMLSATWVDADTGEDIEGPTEGNDIYYGTEGVDVADAGMGDDLLFGGGGDDTLDGGAGSDTIQGGEGDDLISGGLGTDTADYSDADGGVTIDLTDANAQDTGSSGMDTLDSIERVIGSDHDDTFGFDNPVSGSVYGVDGGQGFNTIDLSNFARDDVSIEDGSLIVDMGDGSTFTIEHEGVDRVEFSDGTTNYLTWDGDAATDDWSDASNWSGDQLPTEHDVLIFDGTSSHDVTFDSSFPDSIAGLHVDESYHGDIILETGLHVQGDFVFEGGHFDADVHGLDVDGDLRISGGTFEASAGTTSVSGDFALEGGNFRDSGGTFVMDGDGDQAFEAGGARFQNFEIDKAGGTMTMDGSFVVDGNFTHTAGTVDAGTSTIEFQGSSTTIDAGSIQFHDVILETSGNTVINGTLDVDGDLTIERASNLNGGEIRVAGDVTSLDWSVGGSATVVLDGDGVQTIGANGGVGELHDLEIDKPGGSVVFTDHVQISGDLTHTAGDVDTSGATIEFQGSSTTIDAGSIQFHDVILETSGNTVINGTLDVDGDLTIERASNLNGGEIRASGNVTSLDTSVGGSSTLVLDGDGIQTIGANGGVGELHDLEIDKPGGSVVFTDHVQISGDLTHTAGDVDTSGATIEFQGSSTTIDVGSIQFHDVILETSGNTVINGTLDVDGDLTIERASNLNGGEIRASGNVTSLDTSVGGSSTLVLDGDGIQTIGANGGVGELHDLEIDKPGGSVVFTDHVQISGDLTHTAGDVDTSGATIEFQGSSTTIDVGSIQFHDVILETSGNTVINGTLDVDGDLTIERASNLNGGEIRVAGDVTSLDTSVGGSATVVLDGAGAQTIGANGGVGELHHLEIDKPDGTVTFTDHVQISGDLTHTAGTVDTGTSTIEFQGTSTTIDVGSIQFHDVTFYTGGNTEITGTLDVDGDLTIRAASNLNGGEIRVAGDVTSFDTSVGGSATVVLDGAGAQTIGANGGVGELHHLEIDKPDGTVTFTDHVQISGDLTHTAGTVDTGTSTIEFQGTSTTIDVGSIQFHDVTFYTGGDTEITGTLDVDGDLTIRAASNLNGGEIRVAGDVTSFDTSVGGSATVVLDGAGAQTIGANGGVGELHDLEIDKPDGTVTFTDHVQISGDLTHTAGTVDMGTSTIEFQGTSTTIDAGSIQFHDVTFYTGGDTEITGTLDVDGDLTIRAASNLNGGEIRVAGDVDSQDGSVGGSASLIFDGIGNQTLGGRDYPDGDFTVDKPDGSVLLEADLDLRATDQDLSVVSGDFDLQGHTLEVAGVVNVTGGSFGGSGTLDGDVVVGAGGALHLDVSGSGEGEYDLLVISGEVTLGDEARIELDLSGFGEGSAVLTDIVQYGGFSGDIDHVEVTGVADGLVADVEVVEGASGLELQITVGPDNAAPAGVDDAFTTQEDTPLTTGDVLANDFDADGDTLTVDSFTQPENGIVVYNGDGTFTYTPNGDYNGTDTFTYTVTDPDGEVDTATIQIQVEAVNDGPVISVTAPETVEEGDVVTLSGSGFDAEGEDLTFEWVQTGGPEVTLDDASSSTPSFTAPELTGDADVTFELRVSDGENTTTETVSIHVEADNDGPVISVTAPETVEEGDVVTLSGSGFDAEGEDLTFEWVQTGGPEVTLDDASSSTPSFTAPELTGDADVTFELRVSDGENTTTETVSIHVEADNDGPVISVTAPETVEEGDVVTLSGSGFDAEGEDLTFEWVQTGGPEVTLDDASSSTPSFTAPELAGDADVTFELRVSDGENTTTETVSIHVVADNDGPIVRVDGPESALEGDVVRLTGHGFDAEGDDLTFDWVQSGGPAVVMDDVGSRTPSFVAPEVSGDTPVTFQVRVSDGETTTVQTITIVIRAASTEVEVPEVAGPGEVEPLATDVDSVDPALPVDLASAEAAAQGDAGEPLVDPEGVPSLVAEARAAFQTQALGLAEIPVDGNEGLARLALEPTDEFDELFEEVALDDAVLASAPLAQSAESADADSEAGALRAAAETPTGHEKPASILAALWGLMRAGSSRGTGTEKLSDEGHDGHGGRKGSRS